MSQSMPVSRIKNSVSVNRKTKSISWTNSKACSKSLNIKLHGNFFKNDTINYMEMYNTKL